MMQLPYPDGLLWSVLLVYVLCCAIPSYVIHELCGWWWPWDRP